MATPGDGDGSYLVVDIASARRRYGRLIEFPPAGSAPPPWESRVLNLYAEYAATALDIFSVLTEAKRSDATARTLLSFSESLSRVTTLAELVQLLADTVPAVTDCDQATVYLWDARHRTAGAPGPRPRASSRPTPTGARSSPVGPSGVSYRRGAGRSAGDRLDDGAGPRTPTRLGRPAHHPAPTPTAIERMMLHREVMVLDASTEDPVSATCCTARARPPRWWRRSSPPGSSSG